MELYEKLGTMKIVLVDDNDMLRENIALYLRMNGCSVRTFENGEEAAESFGVEAPDLVISDYLLPGRDGLALLKQLARDYPLAKRILITAFPREMLADEVGLAGIDAMVLKPFTVEELERILEQVIGTGIRKTG